jgi:hypothetical protein
MLLWIALKLSKKMLRIGIPVLINTLPIRPKVFERKPWSMGVDLRPKCTGNIEVSPVQTPRDDTFSYLHKGQRSVLRRY